MTILTKDRRLSSEVHI